MIVIGVDPGARMPAHVCPATRAVARHPLGDHADAPVFVEGQYPRPKSSRQSLMTLSFYAGLHAGAYLDRGHPVYIVQPKKWRSVLLGRKYDSIEKQVFQNLARRQGLLPDWVWSLGSDEIDAHLIAQAGEIMITKRMKMEPLKWTK